MKSNTVKTKPKTNTKTTTKPKDKPVYNNKLNKILLAITIFGLISVIVFPWLYYTLPNVGVLGCDEPGAGANCGDADFGGVIFWFYGIPLIILGLAGLLASAVMARFGIKISHNWGLLKLVVLTLILCSAFFGLLTLYTGYDSANLDDNPNSTLEEEIELNTDSSDGLYAP